MSDRTRADKDREDAELTGEAHWRPMLAAVPLVMARADALRDFAANAANPQMNWRADGDIRSIEILSDKLVRIQSSDRDGDTYVDDIPIECFWLDDDEALGILIAKLKDERERAEREHAAEVQRRLALVERDERAAYEKLHAKYGPKETYGDLRRPAETCTARNDGVLCAAIPCGACDDRRAGRAAGCTCALTPVGWRRDYNHFTGCPMARGGALEQKS
jgi:hypothetical protein